MALDTWKAPLEDLVDPTKLANLAANDGDIPFVGNLAAASSCPNFAEAYRHVMMAISQHEKFKTTKKNAEQCSLDENGWNLGPVNEQIFADTSKYIKSLLSSKSKDLSSEKKTAWQKAQTHLSAWNGAFSAHQAELAAAIIADLTLFANHGPITVAEAVELVMKRGGRLPDSLPEIVRWYLFDIRKKYRKDIEIKAVQVECPKCHRQHDEGATCSHCQRIQKVLEEAQAAERKGDWATAKAKAEEVQTIWKGDSDAERIIEVAKAALQKIEEDKEKVRLAEGKIRDALGKNPPDIDKAWASWKEARGLNGFTASKWEDKIRQKEEEKKRLERVAEKMREFDAAWGNQEWEKAKRIGRELAALGEKSESYWNSQVEQHKQTLQKDLGKTRDGALVAFAAALGRNDVAGARGELEKAKDAQGKLHAQFGALVTVPKIAEAEKKLAELERRLTVDGLKPVRDLAVVGSQDGTPQVTVSWQAAGEGTPAAKWRVLRRKKGEASKGEPLEDVRNPAYMDRGERMRLNIGVEYEYGIVPLAEVAGSGGQKILKANEKAIAWSAAAVCKTKLAPDALQGRGEGELGHWGFVNLSWRLPAGLDVREGNIHLKLSRGDGRFQDKDVTAQGEFQDDAVEVGQRMEYTLALYIVGQESGRSTKQVSVEATRPPDPVQGLSAKRLTNGTWLTTWIWPHGVERVLLVRSATGNVVPKDVESTPDAQIVTRQDYERRHGIEVRLPSGMSRITVFSFKEMPGRRKRYSQGAGIEVVIRVEEITCEIVAHSGGLFRKEFPTEIFVRSGNGELPALVIVAGNGCRPQRASDGQKVGEIQAGPMPTGDKAATNVAANIPVEYIRVFLANPETDAERYRLAPPKVRK